MYRHCHKLASSRRHLFALVALGLLLAVPAAAQEEDYKRNLYYRAVTFDHLVTAVTHSDLDGDGIQEVVVAYREPGDAVDMPGGVLILGPAGTGRWHVAWHGYFKGCYPKKVQANGPVLDLQLVRTAMSGDVVWRHPLVRGKDFFFRGEKGSPWAGVQISASSTLAAAGVAPANVFDGDLRSAWAEGAEGTGVGEKLVLKFAKPVNLGLIGMLHGNTRSRQAWLANNRLHRAEITVETAADRFDTVSDVDLDSDLGLGIYGDMVEMTFDNKPRLRYARLEKSDVVSLEIKIASVLLGEQNDDTYVAEIDLSEMLDCERLRGQKPGTPQQEPPAPPAPAGKPEEEKDSDWLK